MIIIFYIQRDNNNTIEFSIGIHYIYSACANRWTDVVKGFTLNVSHTTHTWVEDDAREKPIENRSCVYRLRIENKASCCCFVLTQFRYKIFYEYTRFGAPYNILLRVCLKTMRKERRVKCCWIINITYKKGLIFVY